MEKLHDEFGPLASFWYGEEFMISIGKGSLLKSINHLFDRPASLFEMVKPLAGPKSIQFACGPSGKSRHAAYSESLSSTNASRLLPELNAICKEMVDVLREKPRDEHINLQTYMTTLSLKMLSKTQIGAYFEDDLKVADFHKKYEAFNHLMVRMISGEKVEDDKIYADINSMRSTLKEALKEYEEAK